MVSSVAAPLIVDGFRRVRRSTFTGCAIMERTEYKRYSRDRGGAETAKDASTHASRTRRSASTIGGAAPDDPILTPLNPLTPLAHLQRLAAGARPYHCAIARYRQLPE